MQKIDSFRNDYFFLSNFYGAPVTYDGIRYYNNEAAFQAQKCADYEDRKNFAGLSPGDAKRMGRRVTLRSDWEEVKVFLMKEIVKCKFTQNEELCDKLTALKDVALEEGNTWGDRIWGTVNGVGQNLLGKILMEVRDELIKEKGENTMNKREHVIHNDTVYECEVNMDDSYERYEKEGETFDEFGCADVVDQQTGIGAEYNFAIDNSASTMINSSAIYMIYPNQDGNYETDTSDFIPYQVKFDDPNWKGNLIKAMTDFVHEHALELSQEEIDKFKENYQKSVALEEKEQEEAER